MLRSEALRVALARGHGLNEGPRGAGAVFSSAASPDAVLPCPYKRVRGGQAATGDGWRGDGGVSSGALPLLTLTKQPSPLEEEEEEEEGER